MKSIISFTVLSAIAGALAQVTMNTPSNLVVCQPVQLTWSGGLAPYFISVQDGNNPSGPALQRFDNENGTSLTWLVNLQAGTSVGFLLRDSNGATSQTASVTVQAGSSTSCVGQSASVSGGGTNTGGTGNGQPSNTATTPAGTSTGGTNTTPTGNTSTRSGTTGTGSNTATGASTTNSNAASPNTQIGAAGVVGAALLALLA